MVVITRLTRWDLIRKKLSITLRWLSNTSATTSRITSPTKNPTSVQSQSSNLSLKNTKNTIKPTQHAWKTTNPWNKISGMTRNTYFTHNNTQHAIPQASARSRSRLRSALRSCRCGSRSSAKCLWEIMDLRRIYTADRWVIVIYI